MLKSTMEYTTPLDDGTHRNSFAFVDSFMAVVIILNAIAIGLSADVRRDWLGWAIIDMVFAAIFTGELIFKLRTTGWKQYFAQSERIWNIFEMVLVIMAWIEAMAGLWADSVQDTPAYSVIRVFRLVRITKIIRVLRLQVFSDLLMMINGAVGSLKTLFYSVTLISIPLYMVALVLCESLRGSASEQLGAESFASLSLSFFNVFRCIVGGECTRADGSPIFLVVSVEYGWIYGAIYCTTLVLMTFGLFNVIVAIYVENIVSAAKYNELSLKRKRLQDNSFFCQKAEELIRYVWLHHQVYMGTAMTINDALQEWDQKSVMGMKITRQFFEELLKQQKFKDLLGELDIADEDQFDLFDTLDGDNSDFVDILEMIQGLGKLRGEARRADIISVNLLMQNMYTELRLFRDMMTQQTALQPTQLPRSSRMLPGSSMKGPRQRRPSVNRRRISHRLDDSVEGISAHDPESRRATKEDFSDSYKDRRECNDTAQDESAWNTYEM